MISGPERTPLPSRSSCPDPCATSIEHVLVCLDGSALSDGCLPYARFVAEAFGAKITILHVMPSPSGTQEPRRADALEWEIAKREAERYLSQAKSTLGDAPQGTTTRLSQGFPAEQIVAAAREMGADLTILSTHGDGSRGAPDLGSIAQHVLALAAGSVLLAPAAGAAAIPPNRVLVPLDGSLRCECVLPLVAEMVRLYNTEVLLAHVVTDPTPSAVLSDPDDVRLAFALASRVQANAEAYLARIRARLLPAIPSIRTFVVRRTEERQALLDLATAQGADMLVLAAHGSTCNVDRAFGSVASYLLAHAQLPIFVLQDMPHRPLYPLPGQPARASLSARPVALETG